MKTNMTFGSSFKRFTKTFLLASLLLAPCMCVAQTLGKRDIVFGTDLKADAVVEQAKSLAKKMADPKAVNWRARGDQRRTYWFEEAGEQMPYRVCVPDAWDGHSQLTMVVFLHGGWSNESTYLDQNDKQLVKMANKYGVLLVSPLGAHEAYGNYMHLPAKFDRVDDMNTILNGLKPERIAANNLSEQDVINVIEMVLAEYPIDRSKIFLMGHSMGSGGTWYLGAKYPDYWRGLIPISGPFTMKEGYPWHRLKDKPIFMTEGLKAGASLESSRQLYQYAKDEQHLHITYKEVDGDHGSMFPMVLNDCFQFVKSQLTEADMYAYLMVYFKEHGHNVYFAVSRDGRTFTDVNNGNPVMAGDTIALQRGIRDPHIYRGPDGAFYLAMTDLHIYAKQEGLRDTEWEREGYGWGNNRALVLMKSFDLINWKRTNLRVDLAFPELADIGCVWAPATVYDEEAQQLLLSFTMRFGRQGRNKLYYSYVNNDFDSLLTLPKPLFEHPDGAQIIDSDISRVGNKYHLYYVSHEATPGVKHATSDRCNGGYVYEPQWCDPENGACEAPTLWKMIRKDEWILMYDVFSARPNNMGFSSTTDFVHYTNLGQFNKDAMHTTNFESPKHGAVVQITEEELQHLQEQWHFEMPVERVIEDGGTGPYKAVMREEPTFKEHTVFVPQDLTAFGAEKKLPVLVWGNGACANSPWEHMNFLNEIASHGYIVLATGNIPLVDEWYKGPMSRPQQQIESIDWIIAQNSDSASPYYQKVDVGNICVAGMSCGGLQSLFNCADPRIKTLMICNSGLFIKPVDAMPNMPMPSKDKLKEIHTPVFYMLGGQEDIAYENGMDDFRRISHVPACVANYPVGHGGTYRQPHGGEFSVVALAWLDWQLKGDTDAARMFTGRHPQLLKRLDWTLERNKKMK